MRKTALEIVFVEISLFLYFAAKNALSSCDKLKNLSDKDLHLIPRPFLRNAKFRLPAAFSEFHFRDERHLNSHGVQHLENCFEARMFFSVQSLVKTFSAEFGLFGNLRHTLTSGDVPDGMEKQCGVIRFADHAQIFGDDFFVVEVFCNI